MPVSTSPGKPIAGYDLENPVLLDAVADITRGRSTTILDVGCDTGRLAETLRREHGQRVVGVDVNREALLVAAERGVPVVNFDFEYARGAPFRKSCFDGAILGDVIEHVRDPESLLKEIASLVAPGGFIAISVPNVAFIETRLRLLFGRFDYRDAGTLDRGHLRFFHTLLCGPNRAARRFGSREGKALHGEPVGSVP